MLIVASIPMLLAIIFLYYLRANRRKKMTDRLSQCRGDIIQAHQELNDLLNSDRYVERRTIVSWTKKWAILVPLLRDSKRHRIADADLIEKIGRLLNAFENMEEGISKRNEDFIQQEAKRFEGLFKSIEKYPLTKSQIRSIIIDEYFNLVVAGAGTGKTSTIVGKAAYIIEKGLAKPEEVLLLSFARDAKEEMYKRTNSRLKLNLEVT